MAITERSIRGTKLQVTIGFDEDQIEAIDRLAAEWRTSRPSVVRRAVDLFLAENSSDRDTSNLDSGRAA